ncbi:hypothetical protein NPIL_166271 [Nephila pilipes]|uniref:Uncharacterized protein n=1 Tax=Nephila pilipes TaxID=299642 RepID=A0A8X6PGT9_NEPPI|nr:hypothetical protein NPIL_166271 [Nephila pilipes]
MKYSTYSRPQYLPLSKSSKEYSDERLIGHFLPLSVAELHLRYRERIKMKQFRLMKYQLFNASPKSESVLIILKRLLTTKQETRLAEHNGPPEMKQWQIRTPSSLNECDNGSTRRTVRYLVNVGHQVEGILTQEF